VFEPRRPGCCWPLLSASAPLDSRPSFRLHAPRPQTGLCPITLVLIAWPPKTDNARIVDGHSNFEVAKDSVRIPQYLHHHPQVFSLSEVQKKHLQKQQARRNTAINGGALRTPEDRCPPCPQALRPPRAPRSNINCSSYTSNHIHHRARRPFLHHGLLDY
jgi:hypothetical protein